MEHPSGPVQENPGRVTFGEFEFDTAKFELTRDGDLVRLQEIPARLLQALIRDAGEIVTREQLHAEIWPSDTFVLFDAGLNTAMNKLRFALRDSAAKPQYIETIPRAGYRLIAPVRRVNAMSASVPALEPAGEAIVESHAPARPFPLVAAVPVAAMAMLMIGVAVNFYVARLSAPGVHLVDTALDLGSDLGAADDGFALSPDGQTLVFRGANRLRRYSLSGGQVHPWGDIDGESPFWSPDGKEVAYYSGGKLWRRAFPNGLAREICAAVSPASGSWGSRGDILFASGNLGIFRVSADGGTPVAVTKVEPGTAFHANPTFLPDGLHFVYLSAADVTHGRLMLGAIEGTEPARELSEATSSAVFVPRPDSSEGILVFAQAGVLVALPFGAASAAVSGKPSVISNGTLGTRRRIIPATASANGALVYGEESNKIDQVKIFDRDGHLTSRIGSRAEYHMARPSPDNRLIAMERRDPQTREYHIDIYNRQTGEILPVPGPANATHPVWSPDSKRLVVSVNDLIASGTLEMISVPPAVSAPVQLAKPPIGVHAESWSPDGRLLLLAAYVNNKMDIWSSPATVSPEQPKPIVTAPGKNQQAQFSRDGRLMAYQEEGTGRSEVTVIPFPPDGRKWLISTGGGLEPRWRSDGKELFYLSSDYALMSVKVGGTERQPTFGKPARLFGGRSSEPALIVWHFEPFSGGNEFVVLTGDLNPPRSPLRLRLNWWVDDSLLKSQAAH